MNKYKVILSALLAVPAFLFQSCLSDQEDTFDKPSSQRMTEFVTAAQDSLINAKYGWALEYYPEGNQSYGGFVYGLKFDRDQVQISYENKPGKVETSLYTMKKDMGPVLSFDVHNAFMHEYATPANGEYQGKEGDFEFVIDSLGYDRIKIHGKRSQNVMYLRRLNESVKSYMEKVEDMGDEFFLSSAIGKVGTGNASFEFSLSDHQVTISDGTSKQTSAYAYTDKGIRLYQPLTINGVSLSEINYDDAKLEMNAEGVELNTCVVDPKLVTTAIGSVGSDDAALERTYKNLSHLDQFIIVTESEALSAADQWLKVGVDAAADSIHLSATENKSGHMRSEKVYVVNRLNTSVQASFVVSQSELKDVLGSYTFYYSNKSGVESKASATLSQVSGNKLQLSTTVGNIPVKMSATYVDGSVVINQLQQMNSVTLSTGEDVEVLNLYIFNGGNAYLYNDINVHIPMQYSPKYGTYGIFGGVYFDDEYISDMESFIVGAFTKANPTSFDDYMGAFYVLYDPYLIRNESSSKAKSFQLLEEEKAAANQVPSYLKRK